MEPDAAQRRRRSAVRSAARLRPRRRASSSPTSSPIAARARSTFGLENPLATRVWSAVKTGTSKDMRDNWCIGFTSRYTVGVWVGNFSGAPMHDVSGVTGAAPIWRDLVQWLHATRRVGAAARRPPASCGDGRVRARRSRRRAASGSCAAPRWRVVRADSARRRDAARRRASAIPRRTPSSRSTPTFPMPRSASCSWPRPRSRIALAAGRRRRLRAAAGAGPRRLGAGVRPAHAHARGRDGEGTVERRIRGARKRCRTKSCFGSPRGAGAGSFDRPRLMLRRSPLG